MSFEISRDHLARWQACWSRDRVNEYAKGRESAPLLDIVQDPAVWVGDAAWLVSRAVIHVGAPVWPLVDAAVREWAPLALDSAGLGDHAARLRALAPVVDAETANAARAAIVAANAAANDAAYAADAARAAAADASRTGGSDDAIRAARVRLVTDTPELGAA